jgi:hypothetical protein
LETDIKEATFELATDPLNLEKEQLLRELEGERNIILKEGEEHWRLRSRAIWLASGDNNSIFFHKYATYNRTRKHIWEISDSAGIKVTEQEDLKVVATQYFKNLYKEPPITHTVEQVKGNQTLFSIY